MIPSIFSVDSYIVTSSSMEPKLPVGSLIYVKHILPSKIKKGDIITFTIETTSVVATHQVYNIDLEKQQFNTQGINNIDKNGNIIKDSNPVNFDSYIGKVIFNIPYLGYINNFCTTSPGIYVLLLLILTIVSMSIIIDIKEKKGSKK